MMENDQPDRNERSSQRFSVYPEEYFYFQSLHIFFLIINNILVHDHIQMKFQLYPIFNLQETKLVMKSGKTNECIDWKKFYYFI